MGGSRGKRRGGSAPRPSFQRRGTRGGGGRGRGAGRGRSSNRGVQRGISRKETAHLRQFGEAHPADEVEHFGSSSKKFSESGRNFNITTRGIKRPIESTDESESEEESTPYNQLLSIFGGRTKKEVQIVSESDDEDDEDGGDGVNQASELNNSEVDSENEDEQEPVHRKLQETLKQEDLKTNLGEAEGTSNTTLIQKAELDLAAETFLELNTSDQLPEETVIDEAELDPDASDECFSGTNIDPFLLHFERELPNNLQILLSGEKPYAHHITCTWPSLDNFHYLGVKTPEVVEDTPASSGIATMLDISAVKHSRIARVPEPPSNQPCTSENLGLTSLFLKQELHSTIPLANQVTLDKQSCKDAITPLQKELLSLITRYRDIYFPQRTFENEDEIRLVYCIHAANHVLKTRTRIIHHNAKLINKVDVPDEYRDQGFVRPKVLILTPFKETALRIVKALISIVLPEEKGNVQNKKRFIDEYGGETLFMPKTNPKPDDYMATFVGNVDDNFKIGLAITKKVIKLYTGFYSSDIIIASPLGLRLIVGADGEKDRDYDFLSSIEVLIADQADICLMQSWDHVLHLMKHINLRPVATHGTDFARIRPWALDSLAKYYCQTLVFSALICPEHIALFSRHCRNYAGFVKVINPIFKGSITQITVQLPQIFQQFDCASLSDASEARFEYFVNQVLPNFKGRLMSHTLIFVSSYFDFVRLRNYFKKEETSFVQICEYTKDNKIARARDLFFHGQNHFMVYTERAHFFRRFRLKGIGHIIFYQLPQYPHFYAELCNSIQEGFQNRRVRQRKNCSVNIIYCKYDAPRLAGVVGTDRSNYMLSSDKKTHAIVSGEL